MGLSVQALESATRSALTPAARGGIIAAAVVGGTALIVGTIALAVFLHKRKQANQGAGSMGGGFAALFQSNEARIRAEHADFLARGGRVFSEGVFYDASGKRDNHGGIGRGGQGTVYKVQNPLDGRITVIKAADGRDDLDREVSSLRAVHKHHGAGLIGVQDAPLSDVFDIRNIDNGTNFFGYEEELYDGHLKVAQLEPMNVAQKVDAAWQVAMGVRAIHEAGYIHTDLKKENLLTRALGRAEQRVDVGDFGGVYPKDSQDVSEGRVVHTVYVSRGDHLDDAQMSVTARGAKRDVRRHQVYTLANVINWIFTDQTVTGRHSWQDSDWRPLEGDQRLEKLQTELKIVLDDKIQQGSLFKTARKAYQETFRNPTDGLEKLCTILDGLKEQYR